jgi:hypothetical protein
MDIGQYNTCPHGCARCYGNFNASVTDWNFASHDPHSPLLIRSLRPDDRITDRKAGAHIVGDWQVEEVVVQGRDTD